MKRVLLCLGLSGASVVGLIERSHAQAVVQDATANTTVTRLGNVFTIRNGTPRWDQSLPQLPRILDSHKRVRHIRFSQHAQYRHYFQSRYWKHSL